ncbi:hypothetical protein Droror1_Dr00020864 [Drosera rotundifolia]
MKGNKKIFVLLRVVLLVGCCSCSSVWYRDVLFPLAMCFSGGRDSEEVAKESLVCVHKTVVTRFSAKLTPEQLLELSSTLFSFLCFLLAADLSVEENVCGVLSLNELVHVYVILLAEVLVTLASYVPGGESFGDYIQMSCGLSFCYPPLR